MGVVTLADLRNLSRLYANERPGGADAFVSETDLNAILNMRLASFYDLVVQARGHENYAADTTFPTVAATATYTLPANCYQVITVHLEWSSSPTQFEIVNATSVRERLDYQNFVYWQRGTPKAYRMRGTQGAAGQTLEFFPTPSLPVPVRVRYIPLFQKLTSDSDTFDSVNGWENLIALAAAIDLKTMAEKPLGPLPQLLAKEEDRVRTLADQRSTGEAAQVVDVHPDYGGSGLDGLRRWI